tara:strand:+ start:89 stop:487 length:399 start_codon:yes stop_codon:yes gene_type:complete
MKIYLASFLEPDNFGPGRVIGVVNGNKPTHVKCDFQYKQLTPRQELTDTYNDMAVSDPKNAGKQFVTDFTEQLDVFCTDVLRVAGEEGKDAKELLPFKDGDTLASWERASFTNYRSLITPFLKKLGYDVITN